MGAFPVRRTDAMQSRSVGKRNARYDASFHFKIDCSRADLVLRREENSQ